MLTAGAYKPVLLALQPEFEQRIAGGEVFDVVVLTLGALEQLGKAGMVKPGATTLARVAIGVAFKAGAPLPDISTVAAFQSTLLSARAVATIDPASGGSSGIYLWQWFDKVGIADRLKPKAVLVPGGLVAERVVNGQADIALHQISEILAVPGVSWWGHCLMPFKTTLCTQGLSPRQFATHKQHASCCKACQTLVR